MTPPAPRPTDRPARIPGGHPHPRGLKPRITRRLTRCIEDWIRNGLSPEAAADQHGINRGAFFRSLQRPAVKQIVQEEMEVLRASKRPRALAIISELAESRETPAPVRLNAAKHLDIGDKQQAGVTVNVGINANIAPGYQVMIPEAHAKTAHQTLNLAGSTRNLLELQGDVTSAEKGTR